MTRPEKDHRKVSREDRGPVFERHGFGAEDTGIPQEAGDLFTLTDVDLGLPPAPPYRPDQTLTLAHFG